MQSKQVPRGKARGASKEAGMGRILLVWRQQQHKHTSKELRGMLNGWGRSWGERVSQGHKANIIREDKDKKQTEQSSLALNKYSIKIQSCIKIVEEGLPGAGDHVAEAGLTAPCYHPAGWPRDHVPCKEATQCAWKCRFLQKANIARMACGAECCL